MNIATSETSATYLPRGVALELPVDRWIPITKAYVAVDGPFPVAVAFDDGGTLPVSSWQDVYVRVASWLALAGQLTRGIKFPADNSRNLVARDAVHSDGSAFQRPYQLPNGLWLDVSGEERLQRDLAIILLRELDVEPSTVQVMLALS